ncbi:hypothetical protein SFRURICE_008884 [Spodoptera frugiperda]|nr:hypothetical protein SFRURICE_008884 [Spodoptera frugiperda]
MTAYFTSNSDFTSTEIKGVKAARSARETYGDSAVGYVQVKREGNICTVKARITPEHNVRQKCYSVTLVCDEAEETVLSVQCTMLEQKFFESLLLNTNLHKEYYFTGGCKHAIAFLAWVHRRSEEPPSTSIECYWKKSKLSSVGTSLKFIKAKDMCDIPKKQPQPELRNAKTVTSNRGLMNLNRMQLRAQLVKLYCMLNATKVRSTAIANAAKKGLSSHIQYLQNASSTAVPLIEGSP